MPLERIVLSPRIQMPSEMSPHDRMIGSTASRTPCTAITRIATCSRLDPSKSKQESMSRTEMISIH